MKQATLPDVQRSRWRYWLKLVLVLAIAIGITGHAVWQLIFSALGQPWAGKTGILVLVLHGVLMTTGLASLGLGRSPRLAYGLGSSLTGAVIGFFYGGSWFAETLLPAVIGALLLMLVGDFLSWYGRQGWVAIALMAAIVTLSSATVFLLGTTAIAALTAGHILGVPWSSLTLLYLWFTWRWSWAFTACLQQWHDTWSDPPLSRRA
ncbi:MAG: hypothetical protein ACPGVO_18210 [Spirulinaceae cyanobacterium]